MADTTKQRLVDAATTAFAEHGVLAASLVEITRQAGQRNRGAVHYHFGDREGLFVAVLEQHSGFLSDREGELLERARLRPPDDAASVVEAIIRPAVELAETGWRGRCYLVIVGELIELDLASMGEAVQAALAHTGGYAVYALLAERMPPHGRGAAQRAVRPARPPSSSGRSPGGPARRRIPRSVASSSTRRASSRISWPWRRRWSPHRRPSPLTIRETS